MLTSTVQPSRLFFFFFNDTATTEIYTLSLHDALPISPHYRLRHLMEKDSSRNAEELAEDVNDQLDGMLTETDRKSTRLNSSHSQISYAVFCLKKKKK